MTAGREELSRRIAMFLFWLRQHRDGGAVPAQAENIEVPKIESISETFLRVSNRGAPIRLFAS
jgi:hypothetical protein